MDHFQTTRDHELAAALRCATMRCAWFDYDSNWTSEMGTPFTVRCERCGRERRDVLDVHGEVIGRHYYPSRPMLHYNRGERPSMADFRRMLLAQRLAEAKAARRRAGAARRSRSAS